MEGPEKLMRKKKKNRTAYMLNKEWYCDICKTGKNYTLAGTRSHLKTKKHMKNEGFVADDRDIKYAMQMIVENEPDDLRGKIVIKKK